MFHIGNIKKKVKLSFVAGLTVFGLLVGATGVVATNSVSAQGCDKVNVIYCGLSGSSASGYISSLRSFYNSNRDSYGNTNIRAVLRWSGFTDAKIKAMNTNNTKVGTLYRNGEIKVGGKVVANKTWVSARFGAGQAGFKHVDGNVWARLTTTSFANASVPVLIHYNADGVPDAGVMVHCGNSLQFHPTVPPQPKLICDNLSKDVVEGSMRRTYTFTARATAKNTDITSYVFKFGDGKSQTVNTSKDKATTKPHTYAPGKTYTATVTVNSKALKGVTSKDCKITVVVPKASLSCDLLTATPTSTENEYKLTAKASAANTVITGYDFSFGDGSNDQRVVTDKKQASVTHTYAAGKTYTATVNVDSKDIKNETSKKCKVTIETPESPNPHVSITKLVNGKKLDNVTVGGEFTYQLEVKNDGNMPLKNVVVTDTPAAGTNIQLVSAELGDIDGNTWTYTIPELKVGESITFELKAKVTVYTEGELVNNACVNAPEVNPSNPEKQDDCDTANVKVKKPNVTITKLVDGQKMEDVTVDQEFTYQLKVTNTGQVDLKNVVVTDPAPAGVTMLATDKGSIVNNALSYTIPELKVGQSENINITAKVAEYQEGYIVNTACVDAPEVNPESEDADACDTAKVKVKSPNVTITKYVDNVKYEQVDVDQEFTYQLKVTNTGQVDLKNVVVTDPAPAGVTMLATDKGSIVNNALSYTIPELKVGQSENINITAKVAEYQEGYIVNTACVNAPEVNPNNPEEPDACDSAKVSVVKLPSNPNITITKYVGTDLKSMQVSVGGVYSYRLIVTNTGELDLTDVVVTDTPDDGIVLVSAAQGTITDNTWTYTIPALAAGESVEFTLNAKVVSEDDTSFVNTACVDAPDVNPDSEEADACDTAVVTVPPTPETPQVLPNTGAGSVIGIFGVVSVLSALAYRMVLGRRLAE